MAVIQWNETFDAVEVDSVNFGHFLVSSLPTMVGTLEDAVLFCNRNRGWKLPGLKEAKALFRHRRRINSCLKEHSMPQICRKSFLWTDEFTPFSLWKGCPVLCLYMSTGSFYETWSDRRNEFRLIYPVRDGHGT